MSAPEPDDRELVGAARRGDSGAFGQLYERYARLVHGMLLARVPPAEVPDLVQDVFVLAWRKVRSLRDSGAFGAWLGAIVRNRARDYYRRHRALEVLVDWPAAPEPRQLEALAALAEIRNLPEAYRETLILRLVEGMTGPEIALRTGLTPDSVRVNLHRGVKLLRERLSATRTTRSNAAAQESEI